MLNINYIDFIGYNIEIINSSDPTKIGLKGLVIYQTKNILILRKNNNEMETIKIQEILDFKKI